MRTYKTSVPANVTEINVGINDEDGELVGYKICVSRSEMDNIIIVTVIDLVGVAVEGITQVLQQKTDSRHSNEFKFTYAYAEELVDYATIDVWVDKESIDIFVECVD